MCQFLIEHQSENSAYRDQLELGMESKQDLHGKSKPESEQLLKSEVEHELGFEQGVELLLDLFSGSITDLT